jgi:hypothetical protein
MRETASGESPQLPLHVILDAAYRRIGPIEQEIGGAAIAVVRKTDAAGVGDRQF